MKLIIDAYNLMKQVYGVQFMSDQDYRECLKRLNRYAKYKKIELLLIFDGGNSPWVWKDNYEIIELIYVGKGKSADDYIKDYVSQHRHGGLVLVSSDHALKKAAAHAHIPALGSMEFWALVVRAESDRTSYGMVNARHGTVTNINVDVDPEVYEAIMQGSQKLMIKSDDVAVHYDEKKRMSKEERKLWEILKKL